MSDSSGRRLGPDVGGLESARVGQAQGRVQRRYDLEERTLAFAKRVRQFVGRLPRTSACSEDGRQLIRSSGSVGANYIEANEALSKKDFLMRIRISRKEAKESAYWLKLLEVEGLDAQETERQLLLAEANELTSIFGAILRRSAAE